MKKLIPALCMLLVAAALLGTSTFAWFSMNTMVEANGMSVQAETSANLVIKNSATGATWSRAATASYADTQTLMPASTSLTPNVLSAGKFFAVTNSETVDYDNGTAAAGTTFEEIEVSPNDENTHVSCNTFTIGVEGTKSFEHLYVTAINVTNNTNEFAKSLRVAVVTENKAYIYAPVSGATIGYKGIAAEGPLATALSDTAETLGTVGLNSETADLGAISNTASIDVTIYVWFEGQDESCTSGNAFDVGEMSVGVQFTAVE